MERFVIDGVEYDSLDDAYRAAEMLSRRRFYDMVDRMVAKTEPDGAMWRLPYDYDPRPRR